MLKWHWSVLHLKNGKTKELFISVICAHLLIVVWLSTYGINNTIDKTISVDVYKNNGEPNTTSFIIISGNLKKTLFSSSFVGTFAIDYYEPSCKDGMKTKIDWQNDNYQNISFYYAGNFSRLDVRKIDIDKDMNHVMIVLDDGTTITSPNYYSTYRNYEV